MKRRRKKPKDEERKIQELDAKFKRILLEYQVFMNKWRNVKEENHRHD